MDLELEELIDEAGRGEVFRRARALGWGAANPPEKYVWRQLAHEVKSGFPPSYAPLPGPIIGVGAGLLVSFLGF